MFKKCKANCQANDNLYIRNDVFYYMVELPRQDGKRRYFIKSLHTKDYYEALERLKLMKDDSYSKNVEAKTLIFAAESISKSMFFDEYEDVSIARNAKKHLVVSFYCKNTLCFQS